MIKTFEELDCWKKAASLRRSLGLLVKTFPQAEKFISEDQLNKYKSEIQECLAILNGFINYLAKAKLESRNVSEPIVHYQITDNG